MYISLIYVWDKVEPVHREFVTITSLEMFFTVTDDHVFVEDTDVLLCNISCVAVGTYILYVNNHFRYVGTANVMKCCERMDVDVLG